jgi:hypothetical protein
LFLESGVMVVLYYYYVYVVICKIGGV